MSAVGNSETLIWVKSDKAQQDVERATEIETEVKWAGEGAELAGRLLSRNTASRPNPL